MKICFLTNTLNIDSGWGRYSWEVVRRIEKEKDVKIIVLTENFFNNSLEKPILKNSCKNLFFIFYSAIKARRYIKQCDIIHCLDAYPYGIIGALANIGLNKKLIVNGVGSYSVAPLSPLEKGGLLRKIYRVLKKNLLKWTYVKTDSIPCISSFFEKQILKLIILKNTKVVHLGIDFDKFQISNYIIKKDKKDKIILSVGELKRRKGYHISIPAIVEVRKKYPNLKYYIVGHQKNKPFFNKLKKLAEKHQLENNIIFLQGISDKELIKLYHQSDLFLLTSVNIGLHFEGFGLVYLEANACGKPVIGTYNCGAEDAIKNEFNGLLVQQNNIKNTSDAILKILDNPELAQELGENGIKRAKEMSWQNTVKEYIKIYEQNS
ncbi:glycosyltransferase family 4 protein [Patescibacteria group bacterium]